jgi:hypothetical protein
MSCADMVILFVGIIDDILKQQIIDDGGKVVSIITKHTNTIITKNNGKAYKRLDEAKEKNIKIIYLDDFIEEHKFSVTPADADANAVAEKKNTVAPAIEKKTEEIDLIYAVNRVLVTKNANDKKNALNALKGSTVGLFLVTFLYNF